MTKIDDFLNSITMYRLMLYFLLVLLGLAAVLAFFNLLPFSLISLIFSTAFLIVVSWTTNKIFAKIFSSPTNLESVYITALILSLIITPINSLSQMPYLTAAGILAISSKYILAIKKKHIFNPAAAGVFLTFLIFKFGASWWIGNSYMLIPVLIGGLLVVRKIHRFGMVISFLLAFSATLLLDSAQRVDNIFLLFSRAIIESPVTFFGFILLTEPQTSPPTKKLQIFYGLITGLGSYYLTPETALLFSNIFSYIVSPKEKLILKLKEKIQLAPSIYEFIFGLNQEFKYKAGQYMEWTLGYKNPDSRGNRRYFTIAASPTEDNLRIGVKFYPKGSSFKKALFNMRKGDKIVASQLSGEFTLPKDPTKKLCFTAGGIGVTPFRSIIKYLLDTDEKRDIILFYSNKTREEIVYKDIFDEAVKELGIKVVYVNTDTMGYIDENMIRKEVGDFEDRIFYISGPHSMVDTFEKVLKGMGINRYQIKTDYFPGYA